MIQIYALRHPKTGEVRYVGQTSQNVQIRVSQHLSRANSGHKSHLYNWIRKMLKTDGLHYTVLQSNAVWNKSEKEWISFLKYLGCDLTNLTDGGDDFLRTIEYKQKMSKALSGNTNARGHVWTPSENYKTKMSYTMTGNKNALGHKHSAISKRKMSRSRTGSAATKGTTGMKFTKQHKAKIGAANSQSVVDIHSGIEYSSASKAAKVTGISPAAISRSCNRQVKNRRFTFGETYE